MLKKNYLYRLISWLRAIGDCVLPPLPQRIQRYLDKERLIEKVFLFSRLLRPEKNFSFSDVPLRTSVFIKEGKRQNFDFEVLRGPVGFTNYFLMEFGGKTFLIEGLPRAEFLSKSIYQLIDDKAKVKKILKENGFPVLEGKTFWFFQKRKALKFGAKLGFPLVVKPRTGSFSRGVTTDIKDFRELSLAIDKTLSHFPNFVVERFLPCTFIFRATVVDFEKVFCVKQVPANVVGDGIHEISKLIEMKNKDLKRGYPRQRDTILCKLVIDKTTKRLLKEKELNLSSIPKRGEVVYLQKDSFLKLGGDLVEETSLVHQENIQLFSNVAKLFDARLVGIDFLAQDISVSWKEQPCAILELNSLPCIEMHHFPSSGEPQNVAKALIDMVFRYYL